MLTTLALLTAINCYHTPSCPGDLYMACVFIDGDTASLYVAEVEPMIPADNGTVRKGVTPSQPTAIVRLPGAPEAFVLPANCRLLLGFST